MINSIKRKLIMWYVDKARATNVITPQCHTVVSDLFTKRLTSENTTFQIDSLERNIEVIYMHRQPTVSVIQGPNRYRPFTKLETWCITKMFQTSVIEYNAYMANLKAIETEVQRQSDSTKAWEK